jgi:hypothetical protein
MNSLDYLMGQVDLVTDMVDWYNEQIQMWRDTRPDHPKAEVRKSLVEELEELLTSLSLRKYLLEQEVEEIKASALCIDDDRPTFDEDAS